MQRAHQVPQQGPIRTAGAGSLSRRRRLTRLVLFEQVGSEAAALGDALWASQVDIDRVAPVLHESRGGEERRGLVPGELHDERTVGARALARREAGAALIREDARVEHRRVREIAPVPPAQLSEGGLGLVDHRSEHA